MTDKSQTIEERTFLDGAINAVIEARKNIGCSNSAAMCLQTKAITYAILELAEKIDILTRHLKKLEGKEE